jgi:DUF1680 family protein
MTDSKHVKISDYFWHKKQKLLLNTLLPYQYKALNDEIVGAEPSHAIENFKIAAGIKKGEYHGWIFQDSDLAKWIEAAAYSLKLKKDKALEATIDQLISYMVRAQLPDGYLNTYYICHTEEKRFTNIVHGHELYCLGHLLEAAIVYFQVTKKDTMLNVMKKYLDLVIQTFGTEPGKINATPGHPELEIALMRLYNLTKENKYLDLATFFITTRGEKPNWFESEQSFIKIKNKWLDLDYHQAHIPLMEQNEADGHAVRAFYLYAGAASLAKETNNHKLYAVLKNIFNNTITKRMYVTGGFGSQGYGERFTLDYDLPSDRAYSETCASIAMIFFASKMFEIEQLPIYYEIVERCLYNNVLAGLSLDGTKYFYVNPLKVVPNITKYRQDSDFIKTIRQPWFGCSCCPPNIARLLASLNDYIYSVIDENIYINLLIASTYTNENSEIVLNCAIMHSKTITVKLTNLSKKSVFIRIPKWAKGYKINKSSNVEVIFNNGHLHLYNISENAEVILTLDYVPKIVYPNQSINAINHSVAISYGPFIYALEEIDNVENLNSLLLNSKKKIKIKKETDLGGYIGLTIEGYIKTSDSSLYSYNSPVLSKTILRFIPYYLWANRTEGQMTVFVNYI